MAISSEERQPWCRTIDWDSIFQDVNAWRGACMHHFSTVEAAVTETLLVLSMVAADGATIRLRNLIGQKFEDMAAAIGPSGPFEAAGRAVVPILSQYRDRHEAFRTHLCHGIVKMTVEHDGRWLRFIRTLTIRARQSDRTLLALEQTEAEEKLDALRRDGKRLVSILGQLRKQLISS